MAKTTNVNAGDLNYDKYANEIYDDDIRRSIPGHDDLHKEIINTVREYAKHHEVMKILELGIGTGLTSEKILELIPTASLTAVDFSEQMMDGAKKRLSKFKVNYLLGDYSEMDFDTDFDIVVSVIGIHHQKDEGKKLLFRKIFDSLKAGGVFIFGDLVTYKDNHKPPLMMLDIIITSWKMLATKNHWKNGLIIINFLTCLRRLRIKSPGSKQLAFQM